MTSQQTWTPSRRRVLIAGGLAGGALMAGARYAALGSDLPSSERRGIAFGTVVSLRAAHAERHLLDRALDAAWSEIAKIEDAASLFRESSALSRLNRSGSLENPPEALLSMVRSACELARLSGGAFDPSVQPLWTLYAAAFAEARRATDAELEAARALIGWDGVEVSPRLIRFARQGMALTLNGLAQGYATGKCLDVLRSFGIEDAFLDAGEIGVAGHRPDHTPWSTGIADPRKPGEVILLSRPVDGILATSGDYATAWTADFSHHHILDPKTLRSPPDTASVSVIARSGAMADGLATAFMVMGPERSLALAATLPDVETLIILKNGHRLKSPGFPVT